MTLFVAALGCDEGRGSVSTMPPADVGSANDAQAIFAGGRELRVVVGANERSYVNLANDKVVTPSASPSSDWDLAFQGYDIFTSSGPSATNAAASGGAAFGPFESGVFANEKAPSVPFLTPDRVGGAFLDWYKYEGSPNHVLWSRFHVFGVRDGDKLYKVQILSYYGERDGAAVPALYKVRYAALNPPGPTQEIERLDGSAGGASAAATTPHECLDLVQGTRVFMTSEQARSSTAWHLCFRRQSIIINGEAGGPRSVGGVNLSAAEVANEELSVIKQRTEASERARFDAVTSAEFTGLPFRGDRIVSAFAQAWFSPKELRPLPNAWLVAAANGKQKYLVGFVRFEGATLTTPGTIILRVKAVKD
jgi:hypothetical protein